MFFYQNQAPGLVNINLKLLVFYLELGIKAKSLENYS